jgi:hypothetical protein
LRNIRGKRDSGNTLGISGSENTDILLWSVSEEEGAVWIGRCLSPLDEVCVAMRLGCGCGTKTTELSEPYSYGRFIWNVFR